MDKFFSRSCGDVVISAGLEVVGPGGNAVVVAVGSGVGVKRLRRVEVGSIT